MVQAEDPDSDSNEPWAKRRKLAGADQKIPEIFDNFDTRSEASDTIPFAASEYESIMEPISESNTDSNGNLGPLSDSHQEIGAITDSDVEYRNEKGQVVYNRSAMVGSNEAVLTLKAEGDWTPGRVEIVHQDVGYSSGENSFHEGVHDEQLVKVNLRFRRPANG